MIDDDGDVSGERESAELRPMDDRILAAYRREFGQRRRPWRRALQAVPVAVVLGGVLTWAVLALRKPAEPPKAPAAAESARQDASLVTHTSLAGFKPVDEIELNVLGGGLP
jgi:hypothetical protein